MIVPMSAGFRDLRSHRAWMSKRKKLFSLTLATHPKEYQ